jgi:hypothetical protein
MMVIKALSVPLHHAVDAFNVGQDLLGDIGVLRQFCPVLLVLQVRFDARRIR